MAHHSLDTQTTELSGALAQTLWDLSIIEYRANEFKLACQAEETEMLDDEASFDEGKPEAASKGVH